MSEAMDKMLFFSIMMKGRTPEKIMEARKRKEEEAVLQAQEAGREKVRGWLTGNQSSAA